MEDPKSQLLFSGVSLSLCCCKRLVISLCDYDHMRIISAKPACKSNIVLPPNWGQHLCSSCHVTAHSSSKAPQPPHWKRETDVKTIYSLFFIHCKAYHGMKKPSPIPSTIQAEIRYTFVRVYLEQWPRSRAGLENVSGEESWKLRAILQNQRKNSKLPREKNVFI